MISWLGLFCELRGKEVELVGVSCSPSIKAVTTTEKWRMENGEYLAELSYAELG